ncbi:hypothetical protein AVEN_140084-1 [Araneus ventricosus]|uniref:Retrotransposon gag domain-containing protein n=1 Tax=Araneus ventricosus TaxID=182803 RepID=A0A4Y2Q692_ARAVE|nr:hypothetical protein AVEN_259987-1 [Araneus ventricosus]GBN58557.1 hypothetical protein AVEN_44964-1 [Araneus ventricosus]GBN58603.1 hypothetical protein AVEN_117735-1 [Araneus ventricosus]GBN58615.1 hypothetical protein AVEN_140084-1 [Araneus ventricosus]
MATHAYQIPAQEVFSFQSEDLSTLIARFESFRTASGLINKPEAEQVNSLLYLMGSQSEEIFRTFNLKQTEVDSHEVIKAKFERYFIPTRNVIYDRYKFNMLMQEEDEAVEDFITALPNLAQNCKFPPSFVDEAIRDRIVCGILDKRVSEKLQSEADLTLEKVINIDRQAEIIKKQ